MIDVTSLKPGTWLKDQYGHYYKIAEYYPLMVNVLCNEMYQRDDDWLEGGHITLSTTYIRRFTEVYKPYEE